MYLHVVCGGKIQELKFGDTLNRFKRWISELWGVGLSRLVNVFRGVLQAYRRLCEGVVCTGRIQDLEFGNDFNRFNSNGEKDCLGW